MTRHQPAVDHTRRWTVCAVVLFGSVSYADGVVAQRGHTIAATFGHASASCGDDPDACSIDLLRRLTGLAYGVVATAAGATVGSSGGGAAGGVTIDIAAVRYPLGGADLGKIEALYVHDSRSGRVRFTVADLKAVFSCRDPQGALHPPVVGHMLHGCVPGSRLGVGAVIGELSWDPASDRRSARWGELAAVVNLAGATSSMAYIRGHLDAALRFGGETVWHGAGEARTGTDHVARAGVSLDGVVRSRNGRWEATLQVAFRPAVLGTVSLLRDFGLTADTTACYDILTGTDAVVSVGLDVRASRWSDPANSIGSFDSATRTSTVFIGAVVKVRHEAKE